MQEQINGPLQETATKELDLILRVVKYCIGLSVKQDLTPTDIMRFRIEQMNSNIKNLYLDDKLIGYFAYKMSRSETGENVTIKSEVEFKFC